MTLAAIPTGADVVAYLGADDDLTARADACASNLIAVTRSYTRGLGFTADGQCAEDIAAVIVTAAARDLNTSPGIASETAGSYTVTYAIGSAGYTLRELSTLNSYRRRAT